MESSPLTKYSIVRFVPDPVKDERINIGIVAVGEDGAPSARFISDLKKVRRFSPEHVDLARQCLDHLADWLVPAQPHFGQEVINADGLAVLATEYRNMVQFSEPMVALMTVDEVVDFEFGRFVERPDEDESVQHRPSTLVYNAAMLSLGQNLERRFSKTGISRHLLHRNVDMTGALSNHTFGLAVQNGQPYLAAQVVSLRNGFKDVERAIGSVAWDIRDVRDRGGDIRLSVLLTDPGADKRVSKLGTKAHGLFHELGADVVNPSEIGDWAEDVALALPATIGN